MISGRTILGHLKNLDGYLKQFAYEKSTYFEHLISSALSQTLYLPFCTIDNDNQSVGPRVTWQGSDSNGVLSAAPAGKPDTIAYCCGFNIVVEATIKTGAKQWTDEFAQSIRHCDDFVKANNFFPDHIYILLVTPRLYEDTYLSLRHHPSTKYKIVPLETELLAEMLNTSILALTIRHLDLRRFLNKVRKYIRESSSCREFQENCKKDIIIWQKEVLKQEKNAFIGIKSYETMQKIRRTAVSSSEIFEHLLKDSFVKEYLDILGETVDVYEIEDTLKGNSLGYITGETIQEEPLFECVPCSDFKGRSIRFINAVESVTV
jgi:hypothetical protein